ncbi:transcriptional repressor MprA [Phytobacter diazotrophicus]|uniref:transcriptional repressor MprA n=1 Tax=Phytobacter diazotrophicus TaxID=395631 RepID=UPI002906A275|nr:transcriptional repressor MprA [Phytobacter diazotrophicus]MDU7197487.1 transcriptional repressor MprA [Enterobacteriaceae bacterium]MDV2875492.1 transcriptional repressor MprA [Phytobacter diazotrophicus]
MDNSFTPLDRLLKLREAMDQDFPYKEILLTRLCIHMQGKLLEKRNKMLMFDGLNEELFTALIIIGSQENYALQPSELSDALGVTRTRVTRIVDVLEKRGWTERKQDGTDRRCIHLYLTEKGFLFLGNFLSPQYRILKKFWSELSHEEKEQYENITRKLITQLDEETQ